MTIARSGFATPRPARVFLLSVLVLAGAGSLLGARSAAAADPTAERFGDLKQAIADLRSEAGQDRRAIVKANMLLTPSEGTTFWPLYEGYRSDRVALGDRKVKLIGDFLAKRDSMSEEDAAGLTKEAFAIEKARISIKQKWVSKMSKVLSARTVARFIQIDQKLDSVVDVEVAARVPLIH